MGKQAFLAGLPSTLAGQCFSGVVTGGCHITYFQYFHIFMGCPSTEVVFQGPSKSLYLQVCKYKRVPNRIESVKDSFIGERGKGIFSMFCQRNVNSFPGTCFRFSLTAEHRKRANFLETIAKEVICGERKLLFHCCVFFPFEVNLSAKILEPEGKYCPY